MRARYVVTSTCLQSGTISLTRSLREMLSGKESIRCTDEDGESFDCGVNWVRGVLEGLSSYFGKRRLQVNDVIWITREDEQIILEAAAARKVRPRSMERPAADAAAAQQVETQKVRVPVTTSPGESSPPPAKRVRVTPRSDRRPPSKPLHVQLLEQLEFKHHKGEKYDVFRAYLGRREYSLQLGRWNETSTADLVALKRTGKADYVALLVPEDNRNEALQELGPVRIAAITPEALGQLVSLKKLFPVGPVEFERLLRRGLVDKNAVSKLAEEVRRWVGERAAFSAVLLALAEYNRQQVFFPEDVLAHLGEGSWDGEQVHNVLEVLSGPPFMLLERSGAGEYLLREPVADNLAHLAEYALSLKGRIAAD